MNELPEATTDTTLFDFKDAASISDYARDAFTALVKGGIVSGNEGNLNPNGQSTRSQKVEVFL